MTILNLGKDVKGFNTFGLPFCEDKYSVTLPASSAISLTVPAASAKYLAVFSYEAGSNVWVANNATAAVPAGATFAATTSERNPIAREVKGGDVLSVITSDTGVEMGVTFYAL
jgi:hypothetical protein